MLKEKMKVLVCRIGTDNFGVDDGVLKELTKTFDVVVNESADTNVEDKNSQTEPEERWCHIIAKDESTAEKIEKLFGNANLPIARTTKYAKEYAEWGKIPFYAPISAQRIFSLFQKVSEDVNCR